METQVGGSNENTTRSAVREKVISASSARWEVIVLYKFLMSSLSCETRHL